MKGSHRLVRCSLPLFALLPAVLAHAQPLPLVQHKLDNGLEVLVAENHATPLVTVEVAVRNGSMTEPPDYNGLSHLYEHMFFKANRVLPNQEAFLARGRELGLIWNGTTDTERVNYFFTTTSEHTRDAMVFMRDAIVSPLFDEQELARERVVVTGEIDRNEAQPWFHLWRAAIRKIWWKYPSRKQPIGDRKTVLAATRKKMQTIQRLYYVPNNSVLVVTGDVKPAEIFAQAAELYAGWKRGPDPFQKHPLVKHPPLRRTEVVHVEQPVQTVVGSLTWHGPSTVGDGVELTYAADLLAYAIGEPSSRFQKALVDSGACVSAFFSWYTQVNTGPITLSFEARPDKADGCLRAALAELPRMQQDDYLSDEEMKNAVHRHEVQTALERERPSSLSHVLTFWWTSAGLPYYFGYLDGLRRATRAQIGEFMRRYVLGKPFVLAVLVSPEMVAQRGLDRAHFVALVAKEGSR